MILVIKDRKSDIEVGRGTEAYLTDGFSGSVLRAMRPDLRAGQYGPAILQGLQSMAAQIAQGKGIEFNGQGRCSGPEASGATGSSAGFRSRS